MNRSAALSPCGLYRYRLSRTWGDGERMAWIMLNPSTADAELDDPTIRRCIGFAKREGYGGIEVINLYALRCTRPAHLRDHPDPEGPDNPAHWRSVLDDHSIGMVVAAWGAGSRTQAPPSTALAERYFGGWYCLGTTAQGEPRHPLYVRADRQFITLNIIKPGPPQRRGARADTFKRGVSLSAQHHASPRTGSPGGQPAP